MTDRKLKTIFLVSRIFSRKADNVILLGFECTINTQNLNKIVRAIFGKMKIFNFLLMLTILHCEGRSKTKTKRERERERGNICRGLEISNLNKIGQLV